MGQKTGASRSPGPNTGFHQDVSELDLCRAANPFLVAGKRTFGTLTLQEYFRAGLKHKVIAGGLAWQFQRFIEICDDVSGPDIYHG